MLRLRMSGSTGRRLATNVHSKYNGIALYLWRKKFNVLNWTIFIMAAIVTNRRYL